MFEELDLKIAEPSNEKAVAMAFTASCMTICHYCTNVKPGNDK